MHRNEMQRALGLSDAEADAIHEAWKQFPGRNTNDNIHPAFAYGWIARGAAAAASPDGGEAAAAARRLIDTVSTGIMWMEVADVLLVARYVLAEQGAAARVIACPGCDGHGPITHPFEEDASRNEVGFCAAESCGWSRACHAAATDAE